MARTTPGKDLPVPTKRNLPTDWRGEMAKHATAMVEQESSVATGQFITTRAGQLSYQGTPFKDNKMQVVVVDARLENAYYEDKFDPDNPASPVCYALGNDDKTMKPHEKSSKPQADFCRNCKWNEFESADQGRGKACKNIRRLALLPGDEKQLTPAALEKNEFAILKVPVTSVKGWAGYVRGLHVLQKIAPIGAVTEIRTQPDPKTQFRILFEQVEAVDEKLMPLLISRIPEAAQQLVQPYPDMGERERPAKGNNKKRKF